jgi:hypothetical protein
MEFLRTTPILSTLEWIQAKNHSQRKNLGRDTFRGPGLDSQNLTLIKRFAVTERAKIEVRSEFFDLFNPAISATRSRT